ncbi:uncharacterized protein Wbp2 isoform X6 [Drosophila kikkawai]|uniref:Uncharacterized protein Wbp2 isoform X6 n=1 Tax=Drosophila kikkawai TaxID=30033 RepID=A0A6P4HL24_DROKI|nr:uncharacterized protein LOC108070425 isoform X7 [Drosophila kikkawai]
MVFQHRRHSSRNSRVTDSSSPVSGSNSQAMDNSRAGPAVMSSHRPMALVVRPRIARQELRMCSRPRTTMDLRRMVVMVMCPVDSTRRDFSSRMVIRVEHHHQISSRRRLQGPLEELPLRESTLWASACRQECNKSKQTTVPQKAKPQQIPKKLRRQQVHIIPHITKADPVDREAVTCHLHIITCHPAMMMPRKSPTNYYSHNEKYKY